MEYRNGGELLVQLLRDNGVDTVFGLISVHNLPLIEAVERELRFVPVRHEAAAVNAADGYARVTGRLGCAITSTGTGAGNASGSMIEALSAGSPVLHVTANIPTEYLDAGRGFIHEFPAQPKMLDAVSKWSIRITDADLAPKALYEAVGQALRPPQGPVTVEWPIDLQYAAGRYEPDAGSSPSAPFKASAGVEEAAELLGRARRPVFWIGGGGRHARTQVRLLAERIGAGVFTSNAGRGSLPEDHPLCVGNFAISAAGQGLLDQADILLSVGTHFRSNETNTYKLRLPTQHVQVDLDPKALGRVYPASVGLVGEAGAVLEALASSIIAAEPLTSWLDAVTTVRRQVRSDLRAAIGPYSSVCDAIRSALPRDAVIVRDVTIPSSSWGNRLLDIYDPRTNVFARGGGIGQGLAMAIGAALGRPGATAVLIVGDGGLAVHMGELLTLVQEQARLTVLVFNDRGYGVLRNTQIARGVRPAGVDLHTPDFETLARSLPLDFMRIERPEDASAVIAFAVAAAHPMLVEIDVDRLGPMTAPFTPPVEVPEEWT